MLSLSGIHHLSLSVIDLERSVRWYGDVLGFAVTARLQRPEFNRVRLHQPDCDLTITLTCHLDASFDGFDERRTGLDHLAFRVASLAELEGFEQRFTQHAVPNSGIKPTPSAAGAMITCRDPDHVQLELVADEPTRDDEQPTA